MSNKKDLSEQIRKVVGAEVPDGDYDDDGATPASTSRRQIIRDTKDLGEARSVPIEKIMPDPGQPRSNITEESVMELADSIRVHGVLEPITVEYVPKNGSYLIISGERRYQASRLAGLAEVPCLIYENLEENRRRALQLVENLQREDLSPIDKARSLIAFKGGVGTWEEVDRLTGFKPSRRKQLTALLNLPEDMQKKIVSMGRKPARGQVTEKHARALLLLRRQPEKQQELFSLIQNKKRPLTGDQAMEKADELRGKLKLMTFTVKYGSKEELIRRLEEEIEKLRAPEKKAT